MSGASHTPGPWLAGEGSGLGATTFVYEVGEDGKQHSAIAACTLDHVHRHFDERKANARLIAAAPELLAFAEGLDCECDSYHGHTCKRCIVIAKARGDA